MIQQHRPQSPHPSQNLQAGQGPYISPHSSAHSLPQQHQSPYVGSVPGVATQQPGETTFFGAHPSPYSTNSATGSYASSGTSRHVSATAQTSCLGTLRDREAHQTLRVKLIGVSEPNDTMATQAAMSRQPYPPMSSYQTPQSNSPSSMHSPQTDAHGRPLYQMAPMAQQIYYQPYPMAQQQSPYAQHQPTSHHPSITSAPGMLISHQQQQHPVSQPPQHQTANAQPTPMIDTKPQPPQLQRPESVVNAPQGTPNTPAGPGR